MQRKSKPLLTTCVKLAGIAFISFVFTVSGAQGTHGASLYCSPSSGSYNTGDIFLVGVYVSSENQAMNAVSGTLSFPKDKLEVVSLSKSDSIVNLWIQEPSFSNNSGTINFEGIVLNPGFTGSAGKIFNINFKVKTAGAAALSFSSGTILANDGKGTNILTALDGANFSLRDIAKETKEIIAAPIAGALGAPAIGSPTHPNSEKWYTANTAKFEWKLPDDAIAARLLIDRMAQAIPTVTYIPAISSKEISGLADGIWYFHARLKNNSGWGGISNFKLQIDTEKPTNFEIQEQKPQDPTDPKRKFIFTAKDKISGISHYEIQINKGEPQILQYEEGGDYETPILPPGKHLLIVRVVDKAGNALINSAEFTIQPLEPPLIDEYPEELFAGDILLIKGRSYQDSKVEIQLHKEKEEPKTYTVSTNKNGMFTFATEQKLTAGVYSLLAEVVDSRGARSEPTQELVFAVKMPAFLKIGSQAVAYLAVIVPLSALIFILAIIIWYGWYKFSIIRKRIKKEVKEAETAAQKAFDLLKEDIEEQIGRLEKIQTKRDLTQEEEKIIKQFKKDLDDANRFLRKEIKDIEREIK